ncbi:Bidirectional sugar transporter SWEET6b [Morus notabilis]|uniref:Bidirectional sugar transporter SWEET n=1 Tax=Morus notabilis TaxID=981085 RepID=W9QST4_9ROSA|nr:bidirectional sugar transporter SWEET4 [Morus notabilis]EXB39110.1 Bidirectional sugar transporter SWEET6b [Morus notabilis]
MVFNADTNRNVVGITGNVISFGLFTSPIPTFYRIMKKKTAEGFKPDPYLATVLNCMLWVFYGTPFIHPGSLLVLTINSVGLVLELIYVLIFFIYSKNKERKKVILVLAGEFLFFSIVVSVAIFAFQGTKKRSLFVGIMSDIFNTIMYSSPLTIMMKVIDTKSVKYMPFSLSLANFLNGSVWTAFALIKFDIYVLVSNGIGAISGAVQLMLYAFYYRSTPNDDENHDGDQKFSRPNEIQLSTETV